MLTYVDNKVIQRKDASLKLLARAFEERGHRNRKISG
jgi:hypothetical protein